MGAAIRQRVGVGRVEALDQKALESGALGFWGEGTNREMRITRAAAASNVWRSGWGRRGGQRKSSGCAPLKARRGRFALNSVFQNASHARVISSACLGQAPIATPFGVYLEKFGVVRRLRTSCITLA